MFWNNKKSKTEGATGWSEERLEDYIKQEKAYLEYGKEQLHEEQNAFAERVKLREQQLRELENTIFFEKLKELIHGTKN